MYLLKPSAQVGCDTRSVFMWDLTGLKSVLFLLGQLKVKVKKVTLPYYLPILVCWIHTFPKGVSTM